MLIMSQQFTITLERIQASTKYEQIWQLTILENNHELHILRDDVT